jgi:hypothetical protein
MVSLKPGLGFGFGECARIVKCILDGIEVFYGEYEALLPRKPEYGMSEMTRFERVYLIRVFYHKEMVTEFYDTQPLLMEKIADRWDKMVQKDS